MTTSYIQPHDVERIIRSVATREVLSRFCKLSPADVSEKGPRDIVTVADQNAERALARRLTALMKGSVAVGEEAVSADPSAIKALADDVPVWIIDPIDGTHNFVANNARFSTLVALAHRHELLASWTYVPRFDTMCYANGDGHATIDGKPLRVRQPPIDLRFLDISVPSPRYWPQEHLIQYNALAEAGVSSTFFDAPGLEYIELASGRRTAMVLTWDNPWDHAAGILLHKDAGGVSLTAAGKSYRVGGQNALPIVVAPDMSCAEALQRALGNL